MVSPFSTFCTLKFQKLEGVWSQDKYWRNSIVWLDGIVFHLPHLFLAIMRGPISISRPIYPILHTPSELLLLSHFLLSLSFFASLSLTHFLSISQSLCSFLSFKLSFSVSPPLHFHSLLLNGSETDVEWIPISLEARPPPTTTTATALPFPPLTSTTTPGQPKEIFPTQNILLSCVKLSYSSSTSSWAWRIHMAFLHQLGTSELQ